MKTLFFNTSDTTSLTTNDITNLLPTSKQSAKEYAFRHATEVPYKNRHKTHQTQYSKGNQLKGVKKV